MKLTTTERNALIILRACSGLSMLDLTGRLTELGLLGDNGLLTELGGRVADEIIVDDPECVPEARIEARARLEKSLETS